MIGVILAAGDGTRLKIPSDSADCKALKKANQKCLIEYALNNLIDLNIDNAIIVVGKHGNLIRSFLGNKYKGINISYVTQQKQNGLINAFIQAIKVIPSHKDVVLQLADEIFVNFDVNSVQKYIDNTDYIFSCGITYENNPDKIKSNFSIDLNENQTIIKCTEKPMVVTNNIKGTGFCIFKKEALQNLLKLYDEEKNTPNDLCDYINFLTTHNKKCGVFLVADKEFNINTKTDLEEADLFLQTK